MKRQVTLFAASAAGLTGFGWTLATYKAPAETPASRRAGGAYGDRSPNHWSGGPMVIPAERIPDLKSYLADNPGDARVWYRLGMAQKQAGDEVGARESWAAAAQAQGAAPPEKSRDRQLYNLACYRALAGDRDGALSAWAESVAAGWNDAGLAGDDADLDSIRDDPGFVEAFNKIAPGGAGTIRVGPG